MPAFAGHTTGRADFPYIRLLGYSFRLPSATAWIQVLCYSCKICCHSFTTHCIVTMFPLSWAINRGELRSAGISRFIAKPLRLHRSPSLASASSGHPPFTLVDPTRLLSSRSGMFRQESFGVSDACLVTALPLTISILSETPGG